jgi:hypothetical protein
MEAPRVHHTTAKQMKAKLRPSIDGWIFAFIIVGSNLILKPTTASQAHGAILLLVGIFWVYKQRRDHQ